MEYTCKDCMYANALPSGDVDCDKKILLNGKIHKVAKSKVDKPCPSHSDKPIENWRYVESRRILRDCDDSCEVCGRLVDLNDISQYKYIEIQNENGDTVGEKMQCKICGHKGRR